MRGLRTQTKKTQINCGVCKNRAGRRGIMNRRYAWFIAFCLMADICLGIVSTISINPTFIGAITGIANAFGCYCVFRLYNHYPGEYLAPYLNLMWVKIVVALSIGLSGVEFLRMLLWPLTTDFPDGLFVGFILSFAFLSISTKRHQSRTGS